jgi:hypothetical protein
MMMKVIGSDEGYSFLKNILQKKAGVSEPVPQMVGRSNK